MQTMIENLLQWLTNLSTAISLEFFVLLGSFLEEIIAPIPSPFVMTQAAILAKVQNYSMFNLAVIVVIAALAKTASSYLLYFITDKAEDIVIGKFGKYFGVSHTEIEKIGKWLTNSWWDDVLLFLARALPFVPTSLVTVAAGVIKYDLKSFLLMTFLGSVVRNIFYLWVGYYGVTYFDTWKDAVLNSPITLIIGILVVVAGLYAALKLKDKLWNSIMDKNHTDHSKNSEHSKKRKTPHDPSTHA
jgi:membrane protein DedA with SNARE-associated domain